MMKNKKADIIIIGAQKAGSASFNINLSRHPNIYTHTTLEYGLFSNARSLKKGEEYFYKHTVSSNVKRNHAKEVFAARRVGIMYDPQKLLQVKNHNPAVKVVMILRNPIDRAFSAFNYCHSAGMEPYTCFEDAIYINNPSRFNGNEIHKKSCSYIERSLYVQHVKNVYSVFPGENISVFLFEEMICDMNTHLNKICHAAGLPAFQFNNTPKQHTGRKSKGPLLLKLFSPSKENIIIKLLPLQLRFKRKTETKKKILINSTNNAKQQMDASTREYLKKIFMDDVHELESLLGLPIRQYWSEFF